LNTSLLNPEIQDFINANIGLNVTDLALQKNPFPNENWISILNQIAAKTKAKDKLPTWFETANIIYPSKISVEQTSSEKTALYKSHLVSGESLIDLTGGFGIDDFYFSKKINQVIHCEIDAQLSEIVAHNFKVLGANNIHCLSDDSAVILEERKQKFDWIYIDPSRRNDLKGKVFMLNDCLPNVPENLDFYFTFSNKIVIKTAPILDLSAGLLELKQVKNIHIVAVENEVKELLWEIEKDFIGTISIKTINIGKENNEVFEFILDKNQSNANFGLPKKYLYEPNAAIMKSGGFDAVATAFEVTKLHQHSHLYTSDSLLEFPGRKFEILNSFPYQKATMKQFLEHSKINITVRNFPDSVENIRKKWKIKEGGNQYCFFTTDVNNDKIVLICAKINH
jgi:16S rRNA G966 N2-methylase RsmD